MIGSVHIADVGLRHMISTVRHSRRIDGVAGLRHSHVALAAPLRGGGVPSAQPARVALIGFWDDDAALDAFEGSQLASALAGGWSVRLQPLRMFGSWPGVPADVPHERKVDHEGPVAVLTLGRLRFARAIPFFRTSVKAEKAARAADGMLWATALSLPPFVATCSVWRDSAASMTYAFGRRDPGHPDAIDVDRRKPFHHQEAFIRWHPYRATGHLDGRNPLPKSVTDLVGVSPFVQ
ncbi:MAG TPA: spheroidene monooxygenase [Acidimicrobiia bacterium]|nr:spheroidene monooxygenase [Acidimicrobiia bacterium]